ncbi:serine hydrolase [Candidatus Dependentiae bacterium]|nr:serine hydrolase [Candidatus Dependentiae bacterium]
MKIFLVIILLINFIQGFAFSQNKKKDPIEKAMQSAIQKNQIPGGVVLITHKGETIYFKAFGHTMEKPLKEKTKDTSMYDLASLTKLYTATLIMKLHEAGLLDISKPVSNYIEAFQRPDKASITIEQLLTHRSGLPAANKVAHYSTDHHATISHIATVKQKSAPSQKFIYSDLGPIVAGYLAELITGKTLNSLLKDYVFLPLELYQTFTFPSPRFFEHIAPSNLPDGKLIQGRVHDPRAYAMGGLAGNAGIFSQALDVAKFAQLFLQNGVYNGKQYLSQQSIDRMTKASSTLPVNEKRGIGFDIDTKYSSPRGDLFARTSFGHTGFTGTSVWIDPGTQTVVVLLCNSLHPSGKGNINVLRKKIGTLAAKMVMDPPSLKTS